MALSYQTLLFINDNKIKISDIFLLVQGNYVIEILTYVKYSTVNNLGPLSLINIII